MRRWGAAGGTAGLLAGLLTAGLLAVAPAALADPARTSDPHAVQARAAAPAGCRARPAPVDPDADPAVHCLLRRLDRWRRAGLMGVGQQLNVSSAPEEAFSPLAALPDPVAVVGFDLEELARTAEYDYPFLDEQVDRLLAESDRGAVLVASWHATNPATGGDYDDRSWTRLRALLDRERAVAQAFWADVDEKLALLRRFSEVDPAQHEPAAVVLRPFHEANGDWFWWGDPDPTVYRQLWRRLQQRAWRAGVHNVVWAYSANRWTRPTVADPRPLVPRRVDLGGLDSYDPELGEAHAADRLWLEGWSRVARTVPRMALTEVGPHGSTDGSWDPAVITRTARRSGIAPLWAMLWFDDGTGHDGVSGLKQVASLQGGPAWLRGCPAGRCRLGSSG